MSTAMHGIMPRATGAHVSTSIFGRERFALRNVFNGASYNKRNVRAIGGFRAIMNAGDPLSRQNVSSKNDTTGVPLASGNGKFVYDSSDYTTYLRRRAMGRNYNDTAF